MMRQPVFPRLIRSSCQKKSPFTNKHNRASSICRCFSSTAENNGSQESGKKNLPESASVVVVGGGIIGSSVAYHLAKIGMEDVILLERDKLTSGTTWHAAGLINTFGSLSSTSTYMRKYTKELYSTILPEETGYDAGYMPIGFIELACDRDRLHYYRRVAAFNRLCGVDVREISADQVKEKFPLCETKDVLAGFYVPDDGRANPTDATMALVKGAKLHGAKIFEGVSVSGVTTSYVSEFNEKLSTVLPRVTGVTLSNGHQIEAKVVVNCAGMWARQFGEKCGVNIPNQAAEHYYLITDKMDEVDPSWPVVEDSSRCVYIRPEGGGLMFGLFEWCGEPWNVNKIPGDFSFGEIEPDWDRMGPYLEDAMMRVPASINVGAKKFFCGPESFTPDNCPVVGEAPELQNYYVAAGLNSIGILTGGGIGQILAEWIQNGSAPSGVDVTGININRFHKYQSNPAYRAERVGEALGNTYRVHYPDHTPKTCRGAKKSVLHDRLMQKNAYFRDVSGWESPSWFAPAGTQPAVEQESFGRENWFPYWEEEHRACREGVALFDMSFMSKFAVQGDDAGSFLNFLSTANVDDEVGRITYTQWLNVDGYMEADLTVTKLSHNKFMVVATDTMHNHVLTHMKRRLASDAHVFISDVTGAYAQINLQGPRSRDLLQALTSADMQDFPFRNAAEIDIGYARVICMRITYVGELGYELFIPAEQAQHVYDLIVERGEEEFGLRHAGLRALGSLRMEKAYRDYGHDMDNTDTVLECGLGFTCDYDKPGGFMGIGAVLAEKTGAKIMGGLTRRMVQVLVQDPEPFMHHGDILCRGGTPACEIRAASFGHTLGGAVGLAMIERQEDPVTKSWINDGDWTVNIAGNAFPCTVSLAPIYDPNSERIRA
uniref:FAD dependent oxidoreductase domain-containing protein n=1 Tax=Odontella aurita TaxID=265563 RepID=A0A7S4MXY7_9STRA|mmetsp:Transcript_37951/g.113373  ORF Transcript_37951/g.113373 Transcript_37951/m.113373 type:complete len:886 (+) Transcript_37951:375-3032(+)